jgi:aquaporin rerated protein, other eukaryote
MEFADDLCAACFEFLGTTFFLFLGFGGIQAAAYSARLVVFSPLLQLLVISTSMGLSLLVSAWLFFRTTGALFNPDIALALVLVGIIGPFRFVLYCLAQLAAAIVASALVEALTPGPLASKCVFYLNRSL